MSKEEILKKINEIIKLIIDIDNVVIDENTTAKDVDGWDSLTHIAIISSIENEFDIDFTTSQVVNFKNIGDIINLIYEKKK